MRLIYPACAFLIFSVSLSDMSTANTAEATRTWHFDVYLGDKSIGYHSFTLNERNTRARLETEANFDVKFLAIPFFRYRHSNTEIWDDGCLTSIESTTSQNSDEFFVSGQQDDGQFTLTTHDGENTLPQCISTFAYWDESFLTNTHLLNSQNGEYTPVEIKLVNDVTEPVKDISTREYILNVDDQTIRLLYSKEGDWQGLQSTTSSGRELRYVIRQDL